MCDTEFRERLIKSMPTLRLYAYRFTCTADEINELVQETVLKALTNSDKFRCDDNFDGWLAVIMRNTFLNMGRTNSICFTSYEFCRDKGYTDSSFDYHELQRVVRTLPAYLYVPFNMYVSGVSYKEIAYKLEIPIGTVKSRIYSARKMLKVLLEDL